MKKKQLGLTSCWNFQYESWAESDGIGRDAGEFDPLNLALRHALPLGLRVDVAKNTGCNTCLTHQFHHRVRPAPTIKRRVVPEYDNGLGRSIYRLQNFGLIKRLFELVDTLLSFAVGIELKICWIVRRGLGAGTSHNHRTEVDRIPIDRKLILTQDPLHTGHTSKPVVVIARAQDVGNASSFREPCQVALDAGVRLGC